MRTGVVVLLCVVRGFTAPPPASRWGALRVATEGESVAESEDTLYAFGVNMALKLGDVRRLFKEEEMGTIVKGIEDALTGEIADPIELLRPQASLINAMLERRMVESLEVEKARGAEFIEAQALVEGVKKTPSGMLIETVASGSGPSPTASSTVEVHYHGTLLDGTVFDSSVDRGEPIKLAVNQVIKGWQEALVKMSEGDKVKLTIPSDLAYGDGGSGDRIPGGATLCFEVELIKVLTGGVGGLIL
ncbi:hypothetical protein CTAYLR_010183 [Chrysophaeum taylorii]|uniref:peptidylprolyl isomerase n=1 Tax=Chrysophaeum taylorii TaxID=2483200 RepID=A0AAD7XHX1_9STRA|nr:hypothetical protein CTAYLR_010183 [Chrysophaeum taylorii]